MIAWYDAVAAGVVVVVVVFLLLKETRVEKSQTLLFGRGRESCLSADPHCRQCCWSQRRMRVESASLMMS